ncbi:porin [Roseateles sp. BYS78W]|uniref:Porin n=1 Tax=Pelomonas candidula TaxID=3299025 RepID=A0ABW7HGF1_9BURK
MKKALIALAVLGLTGGAAVAQSSVTLFGVIDADVKYVKTGDTTLKKLDSSGLNTSRLGVRGTEDLGGGLKAGFWLESEINTDTGVAGAASGGAFWARRATVSLSGDFGEVRLGRNKTASRLHLEDFDPTAFTGLGSVKAVYNNLGSGNNTAFDRADNLVSYSLPTEGLGGFYGGVDVAAGEGTTSNKHQSVRVGYKDGPLHVSATYANAYSATDKYKLASVGVSYDLGVAKPSFVYTEGKYGAAKQSIWTAAVVAPLGQGQVQASYTDSKANTAADAISGVGDAKLFAVGYVYNLSKRTALYTTYAQIENNGLGRFVVAGAPAAANGQKSSGFDVGIRHNF